MTRTERWVARFWEKTIPEPNSGCVLWTAADDGHGYGAYQKPDKRGIMKAHRAAWLIAGRELPDDADLLHRCDTPACVNVDHLSVGTQADNMRDMTAKGRHGRYNSLKTRCPQGHAYAEHARRANGRRYCTICGRDACRRYQQRRRHSQPPPKPTPP